MSTLFATIELQSNSAYNITLYDQLGNHSSTTVFNTKEELISVFMSKGYIPNQYSVEVITFTKQCTNHVGAEASIEAIKKHLDYLKDFV